jgi:hypothetical protein
MGRFMCFGVPHRREVAAVSVDLLGDLPSVLFTVAKWKGCVRVVWCSGQTERGSCKGCFVGRFTVCTVQCSTVDGVRACSLEYRTDM